MSKNRPRVLATRELPADTELFRCHQTRHRPIHFGRDPIHRFDAPNGEFGVCYLSRSPAGAFAETFLRSARGQLIERGDLDKHALSVLQVTRALTLVQCYGSGLRRNGIDARISSNTDYPAHRAFSHACHEHPKQPDGLIYRARFDDDQYSVAQFERASKAVSIKSDPVRWIATGAVIEEILDRYQIAI